VVIGIAIALVRLEPAIRQSSKRRSVMVAMNVKSGFRMTRHAAVRCQQRCVSEEGMAALLEFGETFHAGDGAKAYFLGSRAVGYALARYGVDLSRWKDVAMIVSSDRSIVTVQHVDRPKRSWRGRH
jgi:hypothetical protein